MPTPILDEECSLTPPSREDSKEKSDKHDLNL
jgi:hypothetical protein